MMRGSKGSLPKGKKKIMLDRLSINQRQVHPEGDQLHAEAAREVQPAGRDSTLAQKQRISETTRGKTAKQLVQRMAKHFTKSANLNKMRSECQLLL